MQVFPALFMLRKSFWHKISGRPMLFDSAAKCTYWTWASIKEMLTFLIAVPWDPYTRTLMHKLGFNILTFSKTAKSRKPFPHMHSEVRDTLSTYWRTYVIVIYLYCLCTTLCPVVLLFWQKPYQHLVCLLVWYSNDFISDVNL